MNDVLDLSRLESERQWSFDPLEVDTAIEQTLRTYRLNAEEKGVSLHFVPDPQLPRVLGNWDLLLPVLDNLVGNALKFTSPGGRLTLHAYPWPDLCALPSEAQPEHSGPSCTSSPPCPGYGWRSPTRAAASPPRIRSASSIASSGWRTRCTPRPAPGWDSRSCAASSTSSARIAMASELGVGTAFWFDLPLEESDNEELQLLADRRQLASGGLVTGLG